MTHGRGWLAALVLLVGCATPAPSSLPSRPPVPDGWIRFTSAQRDIAITVPPEVGLEDAQSGILAGFLQPAPDLYSLAVMAIGPTDVMPQPTPPLTEARLAEWLLPLVSTRRPETYSHSSVLLPVGPAVEVRFSFDVGTPDEVAIVAEAIPTSLGVAYLMANCQAKPMTRCDEFLRLVPQLYEVSVRAPG
jgi:hypothetical protein